MKKRYLLALESSPRIMIEVTGQQISEWTAVNTTIGWCWQLTDQESIGDVGRRVIRWIPGWQEDRFDPTPPDIEP